MQHSDRAKRDVTRGQKRDVTIGGDAVQLVARTRGDARTRKISCQCVIFPFKQYVIFLFEVVCYIAFNSYVIRSNSPVICSSDRYATRATSVVY